MDRQLKQRVVGAAVLVALGVVFIPLILDQDTLETRPAEAVDIPPPPQDAFESRVEPVDEAAIAELEQRAANRVELPDDVAAMEEGPGEAASTTDSGAEAGATAGTAPPTPPAPEPPPRVAPADEITPPAAAKSPPPAPPPPAPEAPVTRPAPPAGGGDPAWTVQLGSFNNAENAARLSDKLRAAGFPGYVEKRAEQGALVYKVRVGPQGSRGEAEQVRGRLAEQFDLKGLLLHYP